MKVEIYWEGFEYKINFYLRYDVKFMSRPGMDKPAKRLTRERKFWVRALIGANFYYYSYTTTRGTLFLLNILVRIESTAGADRP